MYFFGCRSTLGVKALIGIPAGVGLLIVVIYVRRELPVLVAIAAVETAITVAAAALGAIASQRTRERSRRSEGIPMMAKSDFDSL